MDAKIKKYARYLEISAWLLMSWGIFQWLVKWGADWFVFGLDRIFGGEMGLAKYASIAEAFQKLPSEQLSKLKIVDAALSADYGGSWIGLEQIAKLSWTSRFLGFLGDGISVAILVIGFWFFIKLMAQFKKGSVFSIDVIELLNRLAKVIFWFALYVPINRAMLSLIITFQNPPGQRLFMASITVSDVFIFAASWFFMILTSLMHESRKLQEERDLTI